MTAEQIFCEAIEINDPDERAVYLDRVCQGDKALRAQVEALIKADSQSENFLEKPLLADEVPQDCFLAEEEIGSVIGPYKLLEKIGEGGMAVVYMAQQQEPLNRRVALKILKLGMDTKEVIGRFNVEKQVLAMMDHPNIAKVFDAGATDTGRPYFVMELVCGVSITEYCDTNKLTNQQRLELFVLVCNAIHHAHQKGIIHRDLKPSNIMVTLHDGVPVPKVIDFGIAKATNRRLTEKTLFTRYAQMIGTPEYMSPEQAEMSGLDIDTRTDIYSLGVVLYELLVGKPPFDSEYLRAKAYHEMQHVICNEDPIKPSTKLSALGEKSSLVADNRKTKIKDLTRQIRIDLDWIVMKCLEKDRTRRYDSASEFAADVRRHLNQEPILAGPPSMAYRFAKFVQRRKTLLTNLCLITFVVLLVSLGIKYHQTRIQDMDSSLSLVQIEQGFSEAKGLHTKGYFKKAIERLTPYLQKTKDAKIHLLHAQILVDLNRIPEAIIVLENIETAEATIAGTVHFLLSRILPPEDKINIQMHKDEAERLIPETEKSAIACVLRASATTIPNVALDWLDKAIGLEQDHYIAREARAMLNYGMKRFWDMRIDSESLVTLRSRDYLGFALRALAHRELGDFQQAISDHNKAIEYCENKYDLAVLYDQRQETYWRLGDKHAALQDSLKCIALDPNQNIYRVSLSKLYFSLGQYEKSRLEYEQLNWKVHHWLADMGHYISDSIENDLRIEIPVDKLSIGPQPWVPSPKLTLPSIKTLYQTLNKETKRLVRGARGKSSWSPEGNQIAYTRTHACNWNMFAWKSARPISGINEHGIEILDLDTKQTRILVTSGGNPVWSPDGRMIAYVRTDDIYRSNEHIWLVPAMGGEPVFLTEGNSPCWDKNNPSHLLFLSKREKAILTIDIDDPNQSPTKVIDCSADHMEISPDGQLVAYLSSGTLFLQNLKLRDEITRWTIPFIGFHTRIRWSPSNSEISIGQEDSMHWHSGLWVYNLEQQEGRRILAPKALSLNWSPQQTRLAIDLTYHLGEIWLAEVDPNQSGWDLFPTVLSREEYLKQYLDIHISIARSKDSFAQRKTAEHLYSLGENQYDLSEYEQALWTLKRAEKLPWPIENKTQLLISASIVKTLKQLDRHDDALDELAHMREICQQGNIAWSATLCEAELSFAPAEGNLPKMWELLLLGHYDDTLKLLKELEVADYSLESQVYHSIYSLREVLARVYYQFALAAKHNNLPQHQVVGFLQNVLLADPNHISASKALDNVLEHQQALQTSPPIAYWPVSNTDNETLKDVSGNGYDGTFVGDAQVTHDPQRGDVLYCDGIGDWVDCGTSINTEFQQEVTVSVWIKAETFETRYQGVASCDYWRLWRVGFRRLAFDYLGFRDYEVPKLPKPFMSNEYRIDDQQWHHLVGVYNGGQKYLYIDGTLAQSALVTGKHLILGKALCIGLQQLQDSREPSWHGWIDDIRIYNYALTKAEIQLLYKETTK